MEKDPISYSLLTYAWVVFLAVWGGTAHTIKKVKSGELKRFSIAEWVGDIVIAGFIGVLTFFMCEYAEINQMFSAALIGIASHQGARGIMLIERFITKKSFIEVRLKEEEK